MMTHVGRRGRRAFRHPAAGRLVPDWEAPAVGRGLHRHMI